MSFFFFKQKTAYELRISDWSSDVCSSDLHGLWLLLVLLFAAGVAEAQTGSRDETVFETLLKWTPLLLKGFVFNLAISFLAMIGGTVVGAFLGVMQISLLPPVRASSWAVTQFRSEEHTSELQSLMRTSYAVFCLK